MSVLFLLLLLLFVCCAEHHFTCECEMMRKTVEHLNCSCMLQTDCFSCGLFSISYSCYQMMSVCVREGGGGRGI